MPYSKFDPERLTLRDYLAIDRTVLANERTVLAYIRTALTLLVIGVTFFHFTEWWLFHAVGIVFALLSVLAFAIGYVQFIRMKRRLSAVQADLQTPSLYQDAPCQDASKDKAQ